MSNSNNSLHDELRRALDPGASLVHPTYRHLQRRISLAGLTWSQWLTLALTTAVAWLLAQILPLPAPWDLSVAVVIPGVPAIAIWALGADADLDLRAVATATIAWRRESGAYLPLAPVPDEVRGYRVGEVDR